MKKIVSLLALLLIINTSKSQVAVFRSTAFIDSVSQPGTKKYGFKFNFDGINVPIIFKLIDWQNSFAYYGDSIPNVINDSLETLPNICNKSYQCYALNADNISQVVGLIYPCAVSKNLTTFTQLIAPSPNVCNGTVSLYRKPSSDVVLDLADMTYQSIAGPIASTILNDTITNLCSNKYNVSVPYYLYYSYNGSSFGINIGEKFTVYLGLDSLPKNSNLDVTVNPYKQALTPSCDGKARVNVIYSSSPCVFSFDGGTYLNVDSITNLCEGIHFVKIKNATDSIEKYFIVSDANNVINNPNPYGSVIDTIIYNFTNCNFNYNLPIDSAFLVNYNAIDTNTIYLSWQIWQGGTVTAVSDTISYLYQSGTSMVSLMIFCGNGRTSSTANFKTFRINDYVNLIQPVGIKKWEQTSDFRVYPNPFNDHLAIKSTSIEEIKSVKMINILGEEVSMAFQKKQNEYDLNTDSLLSGYYTVLISSKANVTSAFKIIKQ